MDALILVDLQYDFMPGGALAVRDGDSVVSVANRLMSAFDVIVATQDWHPADHASFAANHPGHEIGEMITLDGREQILWPLHCVQNTRGAELHQALDATPITKVIHKGMNPRIDSYSGFFDNARAQETGLDRELKSRGVKVLTVLGLATDYCVKFTVLDALSLGYNVRLVIDGCRGVDLREGDVDRAISTMQSNGAQVETSEQIMKSIVNQ
ncbi:MAG: bifunctional nicotinamidase/pyrazinamidase [Planctomycetes bacterium]|nr:bifunctional nicotinamidase/pyrazinamidase [Planctomycetota bacterium]